MEEKRRSTHGSDPELYKLYEAYKQASGAICLRPQEFEREWENDWDEDMRIALEENYRRGWTAVSSTFSAAKAILEKYTRRPGVLRTNPRRLPPL